MKIFVSYARVDKPYCIRIIETLHAHDVWYDQRLYAGQDWWKEILRRLDWCEVFIYLLSPVSVASQHCRRELEIARRLNRDIIPVLIDSATVLPAKMSDWQYVDLSDNLTVENVAHLLNAILMVERQRSAAAAPVAGDAGSGDAASAVNPAELISNAVRALERNDYATAVRLLRQAKASGYQSRFVRVDKLLRIAEAAAAENKQTRELEREYQHIVALFNFASTREMACQALEEFRREFGDYDPKNLHRLCDGAPAAPPSANNRRPQRHVSAPPRVAAQPATNARVQSAPRADAGAAPGSALTARSQAAPTRKAPAMQPQSANERKRSAFNLIDAADAPISAKSALPMLEWREIPHGVVTIASIVGADEDFGEKTEQVENFVMSKFPVTNAQFAIFAQAQDGYRNPRWWGDSEYAQRFFKSGKGFKEAFFNGENLPRENVNWYEAMAFANWLGNQLKMKIALPTLAQWQRAAKGDDDRYYPWGDDYYEEHCNTVESGLKMTTPVDRYHKGASPYGVYDMAGNVWEWTLNTAAAAEAGRDFRRAVVGGSHVSPCDRAQTGFRHYLDPGVRYSSIGIRLVALT